VRVAIFSDIHGNTLALEAVLADAERLGVDTWWCLGDVAELGYDPAGCLLRMARLPHLVAVRGNADRLVVTDSATLLAEALALAGDDPVAVEHDLVYARGAAWAAGAAQAVGLRDWLVALPLERRLTLPDGTSVLLVHASPGRDDGPGLRPRDDETAISDRLLGADAELVVVGHTHLPFELSVGQMRVWNPGSVSNPVTADKRAMWTLLEADKTGHTMTRRYVDYDTTAMLAALDRSGAPTRALTRTFWADEAGQ
jgi:predicted phosphodiesterase